jgi:hypothetical protein
VGITIIRRYEFQESVPSAKTSVLMLIELALEESGIQFTSDRLVNPVVVLHLSPSA